MKDKKEFYATQFEKLGFEKIPTEEGFTMFQLDPSKLRKKKPNKKIVRSELELSDLGYEEKSSGPGLRIVEHVKWEGKDYPMPFYGMDLETDRDKMIEIQNRFGGESISVPWFAAAVYDVIMGSERLQQWEDHAKGIDWFAEHFPDAYVTLID